MKRYNVTTNGSWDDDGNYYIKSEESKYGKWVKYDDIKDDRALLEEAIQYIKDYHWMECGKADDIVTRAKERGIG